MPSGGILVLCAAIGAVLFVGGKVIHAKPIQKTNHAICRVVTFGQKCKPAKPKVENKKLTEPQ